MAYSLSRAWHHDLLARRKEIDLHLLLAQKLLFHRGGRDGGGTPAPLHQRRDPEKLC